MKNRLSKGWFRCMGRHIDDNDDCVCRKRRYASRREAAEFNPGRTGKPYRCQICSTGKTDVYHVGHRIRRKSAAEFQCRKFKERIEREFQPIFEMIDIIMGVKQQRG